MLAGCYLGETADIAALRSASEQDVIAVRPCPGTGTVLDRIGYEIDRLLGSGLEPSDTAVLSLRGVAEPESVVHRERIGSHRIVRAHDPDAGSNVVAETFLRFKGLERPAIIITDISLALEKPDYHKRMYIALTRALSTTRIIDTRDSLVCDPFLRPLCS
jgi:methyl coenzyme M reductase subunit C